MNKMMLTNRDDYDEFNGWSQVRVLKELTIMAELNTKECFNCGNTIDISTDNYIWCNSRYCEDDDIICEDCEVEEDV